MAQFAPVAPIQILEEMKRQKVLGTYHLLLAHHVLEHPERFEALFVDHPASTIIMDNSIVELGDAASDVKVLEACQVVNRNRKHWVTPVLTDVMGDGQATREVATESYNWWNTNTDSPSAYMVVLQGSNWEDFCKTADYFLADRERFPRIEYVGIPRVLVKTLEGHSRGLAIQYVDALRPDISVHLLGFSDNVMDDIICANLSAVEGIDSAVPLRYAYSAPEGEALLYTPAKVIPPRPATWFEEGTFRDIDYMNLVNIRRWVA